MIHDNKKCFDAKGKLVVSKMDFYQGKVFKGKAEEANDDVKNFQALIRGNDLEHSYVKKTKANTGKSSDPCAKLPLSFCNIDREEKIKRKGKKD